MNTNILFFDIDGTILSHRDYNIIDSTKEAIIKAKENGHLTFINTGRTYSLIGDDVKSMGFDGYVCGCGTAIYYHSELLYHTTIDKKLRKSIILDLMKYNIGAVLEGNDAIYYTDNIINPGQQQAYQSNTSRGFKVLPWNEEDMIFDKFCIWIDSQEDIDAFCKIYEDRFDIIDREGIFLELVPKGHSKATGIKFLQNILNIPHDNAFAFGDSLNDLSMLQYVKHSVGMGNSEEEIKNMVSFLTKDVDEDGIAHALRHFQMI